MDKQGYKYAIAFNYMNSFPELEPCKVVKVRKAITGAGETRRVVLTNTPNSYIKLTAKELKGLNQRGSKSPSKEKKR